MAQDFLQMFPEQKVVYDPPASSKDEVIDCLLEAALSGLSLTDEQRSGLRTAVLDREANGSTGVGSVGIPHVKSELVPQTVGAVAVFPKGIDFKAVDASLVYSVFLLLSPADQADEHVQVLRWIAGVARQQDYTRFARQTRDAAEMRGLLEELSAS